ncbi:MAG: porin family protein [Thermoanaerobaculaceae bacterium]|jgi:opacity protein-like surface antigen|nr:porin family protein [Thermoanaerobaculaceae bacterium]
MNTSQTKRRTTTLRLAGMVLALVACATVAGAQAREGQWEFTLGTLYQFSSSLDFDHGQSMDTDGDFGFTTSVGYHMTDALAVSFGLQWAGVSYDALVLKEGGGQAAISGTYDTWNTSVNLVYDLKEGPLVPYVGAGIGWTWIDTNIPDGLPSTGCWWDPWWGYVCYTSYPTKTTDAFSYQASLGLKYEYNSRSFVRFGYTSQWLDIGKATGTPRFDQLTLDFGWLF